MSEIRATILLRQDGQEECYKHKSIYAYRRGNVLFYQFGLKQSQFTFALYGEKVYIYTKTDTFKYALKLQKNKRRKNYIFTPYGKITAETELLTLVSLSRHASIEKSERQQKGQQFLEIEYILNFHGFVQNFHVQFTEE